MRAALKTLILTLTYWISMLTAPGTLCGHQFPFVLEEHSIVSVVRPSYAMFAMLCKCLFVSEGAMLLRAMLCKCLFVSDRSICTVHNGTIPPSLPAFHALARLLPSLRTYAFIHVVVFHPDCQVKGKSFFEFYAHSLFLFLVCPARFFAAVSALGTHVLPERMARVGTPLGRLTKASATGSREGQARAHSATAWFAYLRCKPMMRSFPRTLTIRIS